MFFLTLSLLVRILFARLCLLSTPFSILLLLLIALTSTLVCFLSIFRVLVKLIEVHVCRLCALLLLRE